MRWRIKEISSIDHHRPSQQALQPVEVGIAVHQPLGHDHQRIGALDGVIGIGRIGDPVPEELAGCMHGLGVVRLHLGPAGEQPSTSGIDGLSRMSSVSALNARPQTPTVLPERFRPGPPPSSAAAPASAGHSPPRSRPADRTRDRSPCPSESAPSRPWGSRNRRSRALGTGRPARCGGRCRCPAGLPSRPLRPRSQNSAIWFMNEIRVASMAFAAYFVTSADGMSMKRTGLPVRTKGE